MFVLNGIINIRKYVLEYDFSSYYKFLNNNIINKINLMHKRFYFVPYK